MCAVPEAGVPPSVSACNTRKWSGNRSNLKTKAKYRPPHPGFISLDFLVFTLGYRAGVGHLGATAGPPSLCGGVECKPRRAYVTSGLSVEAAPRAGDGLRVARQASDIYCLVFHGFFFCLLTAQVGNSRREQIPPPLPFSSEQRTK